MRAKPPVQSSVWQYLGLAGLFALSMISQAPFSVDAVRSWSGDYPDRPVELGSPWPTVTFTNPSGRQAGLQVGDRVVSVDGRGPESPLELAQLRRRKRSGDSIRIAVLRKGQPMVFQFRLGGLFPDHGQIVITFLIMPWLCLALGFWVAAARPRDKLAWLMLGILIGLSQLGRADHLSALGWPAPIGVTTEAFRNLALHGWAICMMLFAFYFPKRGRLDTRLPWIKWVAMIPLGVMGVWDAVHDVWFAVDYASAERLFPSAPWPTWLHLTLLYCTISLFFTGIGEKYRNPSLASDDRRRLRLLYWGCIVSMLPSGVLVFSGIADHSRHIDTRVGLWADMALVLFPITLAYVIVVQRAMDVRMVIRQGVQYALARRGVLVIQVLLIGGVVNLALNYALARQLNLFEQSVLVALGVLAIIQVRARSEGLRRWVDRRFFREAYNADRILGELSEQVRSILDRDALLETVARKISESLHVERIAVMLEQNGLFRPALALGYPDGSSLSVGSEYAPLAELSRTREPVAVDSSESAGPLDAELLLPLASHKELLGFISLGPKRSEEPYSFSDTSLLKTVAAQTGLALENSRLSEAIASEVAQREIMSREMEIAREVQQRLFPQNLPPVPTMEYAGHCRPARGVGGDYYDFLALASGRLGLAIADVSGKGIPAALLMASLQASTRGQSQNETGKVAELTARVNLLVCDASAENRYATFFYAQFNPATRRLIYTNGGHNAPMLLRGDVVMRLEAGGPPVGLFRSAQYVQEEIQLNPGDLLVLYTDGISEAENAAQEEWGEDALLATARACEGLAPLETIQRIMEGADAFACGAPQHDDMTLVIARVV